MTRQLAVSSPDLLAGLFPAGLQLVGCCSAPFTSSSSHPAEASPHPPTARGGAAVGSEGNTAATGQTGTSPPEAEWCMGPAGVGGSMAQDARVGLSPMQSAMGTATNRASSAAHTPSPAFPPLTPCIPFTPLIPSWLPGSPTPHSCAHAPSTHTPWHRAGHTGSGSHLFHLQTLLPTQPKPHREFW